MRVYMCVCDVYIYICFACMHKKVPMVCLYRYK